MFEREVKFIYDFSSNKVKKLGAYVTYFDLKQIGIHPAILRYIAAEIEFRVYEDRQNLLKHSMFDYSSEKISKYFNSITEEIKKEKKFSADFINKIILHATSFNVNYLIRPNWSLKKLIFDTDNSKSTSEIKQILNYVYFYDYLIKVLNDYIDKKKLISLNKDEFDELLKRIDKVGVETHLEDILDQAIESLASFFNIGSFNKTSVPLQGIGVFLKEKKLDDHIGALQEAITEENKSRMDKNDLRSILLGKGFEKTEYVEINNEDTSDIELENEVLVEQSAKGEDVFDEELGLSHDPSDTETTEEEKISEQVDVNETDEEKSKIDEPSEELISGETDTAEDEIIKDEPAEKFEEEFEQDTETKAEFSVEKDTFPEPDSDDESEITLRRNKEKEVDDIIDETEQLPEADEEFPGEVFKDDDEISDDATDQKKIEEVMSDEAEEIEEETAEDDSYEERLTVQDEIEQFPDDIEETEDEVIPEEGELEEAELSDDEEEIEEFSAGDEETATEEADEDELKNEPAEDAAPEEDDDFHHLVFEEDDDLSKEPTLFGDDPEVDDDAESTSIEDIEEDNFIKDFGSQANKAPIDISELLENKNMTKIIQVVFDYDMEDFANTIERICESSSKQEAFTKLDEIFDLNQVNRSSKEAHAFRDIIAEYFDQT